MNGVRRCIILAVIALMTSLWTIDCSYADTISQTQTFSASGSVLAQGGNTLPQLSETIELDLGGGFTAGSIGDYGVAGSYGAEVSAQTTGTVGVGLNATFNDPTYRIDNPYTVNFTRPDLGSTGAGEGFSLGMTASATDTTLATSYLSPSFDSNFYINNLGASVSGDVCFVGCASGEQSLFDAVNVDLPLLQFVNSGDGTAPTLEAFGAATIRSFPTVQSLTYADLTIHAPNVTRLSTASGQVTVSSDIDLFSFQANISNMLMTATGIPLNQSITFLDYLNIGYTTLQGRIGPKLALGTDATFTAGSLTTRLDFDRPVGVWDDAAHTSYSVITSLTLTDGETIPDLFVLRPGETVTVSPTYMAGDGQFSNTMTANLSLLADLTLLEANIYMAGPGGLLPDTLIDISAGPAFATVKDTLLETIHLATSEFDISFLSQTGDTFNLTSSAGSCRNAGSETSGYIFDPLCDGILTKTGAGTLELFAENTYAGGTVLTGGTVMVEKDSNLGDASGSLTFDGGTLLTRNLDNDPIGIVSSRSVMLEAGGGTFDTNGLDSTLSGQISGIGSFTKTNTGSLTLAGDNTYTGDTNVTGGTLSLSGGGNLSGVTALNLAGGANFDISAADGDRAVGSLSGSGDIRLGANAITTGGNHSSTEFFGIISGSGGLNKIGDGTQTLSGINTYTGPTSLNGGILSVASNANLGNGGALVFNGGALKTTDFFSSSRNVLLDAEGGTVNTNGFDTILSGTISGEGPFNKTSTGKLELTAANTYTGATRVEGGTLSLTGTGSLSGVTALDVSAGSVFDMSAAAGDRSVGSLAGVGSVMIGGNSLTAGGNDADTTFSGVISGAGSVIKVGNGDWVLAGANTYEGGTEVSGGTLVGDTVSLQGQITNNAAVVFDQTFAGTYAGDMSGSGTMIKEDVGDLNLTGINTYTGTTTVQEGTLRVNGTLSSDVVVAGDAILGGRGVIGGIVTNWGTFAPGNSIDTIVVSDYISEPGSIHEVEVTAQGEGDLIVCTGNATLNGGAVEVLTATNEISDDYRRRTFYDIITTEAGVTGVYNSVSVDMAELNPMLHYGDPSLVELILIRNDIDFAQIADAETKNQTSVAKVLTEKSPAAFLGDFADVLDLYVDGLTTEKARRDALDEMSGQRIHTAIPFATFSLMESFQGAVGRRMSRLHFTSGGAMTEDETPGGVKLDMAGESTDIGPVGEGEGGHENFWIYLHGGSGNVDQDENASGYEYDVFGVALGLDFPVGNQAHLGVTGGYGTSGVDTAHFDEAKIKAIQVGVYGNYESDTFYMDGIASLASNNIDSDRQIAFGNLTRVASGSYHSQQWSAAAEIGRFEEFGGFNVQPFFGSRYIYLNGRGFVEEGAGDLNLAVESRSTYSWKVFPGLRVNRPIATASETYFIPEVFAKWVHEMGDENDVMTANFTGAQETGSFQVEGVEIDRNSIQLGGSLKFANEQSLISLNYEAEINDDRTAHSVSGLMKLHF